MIKNLTLICFISILYISTVKSQDHTVPGKIITPYPTLLNLAVEWYIEGDDNQNGIVGVAFREKDSRIWRKAMPLRRVPAGENVKFNWDNKHSGSIFDLTPDTLYEIRLSLNDPDGGKSEKTVEVRTRPEPIIPAGAEIIEIQPGAYDTLFTKSGTKEQPVVYQCTAGTAVFEFIDLQNKKWVYLEGLTVDNKEAKGIGVRMDGAQHCV